MSQQLVSLEYSLQGQTASLALCKGSLIRWMYAVGISLPLTILRPSYRTTSELGTNTLKMVSYPNPNPVPNSRNFNVRSLLSTCKTRSHRHHFLGQRCCIMVFSASQDDCDWLKEIKTAQHFLVP